MELIKKGIKNTFNKLGYTINKKKNKVEPKSQVWAVGMYEGDNPFSYKELHGVVNPVITGSDVTDVPANYVADPFMLHVDNVWYMFFEVKNKDRRRGEIGLAISKNLIHWQYDKIVLAEPFHLSYPYVFSWKDEFYMIPETGQTKTIRLYKANKFPYEWKFIETLVSGGNFKDASPFYFDGIWWMYTETNPNNKYDTLRLFYAKDLFDRWIEHPRSPIVNGDPRIARPAGRILSIDDNIIRFAQDCSQIYGLHVNGFNISKLSTKEYLEARNAENPVLTGSGYGWNYNGMHHIDAHNISNKKKWVACVDGWTWNTNGNIKS